jgi:uncharacterized protein (TIGR02646 family)
MIKVNRTAKPQVLQDNETRWVQDIQDAFDAWQIATNNYQTAKTKANEAILKDTQKNLDKAKAKYREGNIKDILLGEDMFNGKCAYCEAQVSHVYWGDIEHFRPKDSFPLLAVDWDNLLYACGICNGASFKGTKFPLDTNGEPLLINPCLDNPNDHLEFEYDQIMSKFIVVGKDDKGVTSIETYGLNRNRNKSDLLAVRTDYLILLVKLAKLYKQDNEAKVLLDKACEKSSPYAAFARMIREKMT